VFSTVTHPNLNEQKGIHVIGKNSTPGRKGLLFLTFICGLILSVITVAGLQANSRVAKADPFPPPEGYPKLRFSHKTVTPTLTSSGGTTLAYEIVIRNTGAYTAEGTSLTDVMPLGTTYNNDGQASTGPPPTFSNGTLAWTGDVGFDASVVVRFSVVLTPGVLGRVENTALISQTLLSQPVTVTAVTTVTDVPILNIRKFSAPRIPGANKPLTYSLAVVNQGQPAINLPITVTDDVPADTTLRSVGQGGIPSPAGDVITWTQSVSLGLGERNIFTFSVDVDDVTSGTVITNESYQVSGQGVGLSVGEPYTVTVLDPIFFLSKSVWPDPPGSNREMTYTLSLLNKGSTATDLLITDQVPAGVTYERGGAYAAGLVSWSLPKLETDESATFTFTVSISDVADIPVVNDNYEVCSSEGVCQVGEPLTSLVLGPTFEAWAELDPIAKKPGGGTGPVTPTLVVHNAGPGNALDATAYLEFGRISVGASNDLIAIPAIGSFSDGPDCGSHCVSYLWVGSIGAEETITFTTQEGQSTIGGAEGTIYTATVVITDSLANMTTEPVTGTAYGRVTHLANLVPTKSAPPIIGRGLNMTYTFNVWNSGLSTDEPPFPVLSDTVPASVTVVNVSNGGTVQTSNGETVVSWTLPEMSPGDWLNRAYAVLVDEDLVSGTLIVNDNYQAAWYEAEDNAIFFNTGPPVTTTVKEVGLVDSYKEVTPTLALPGPGNVLTHFVHIVNTSPSQLNGVVVQDDLPWENSTYQRDAVASAGQVISDIVSISWMGDVAPFSEEVMTFTVLVDPDFKGAITNTATIAHPSLIEDVLIHSVAYITDDPVLQISKKASPDPVKVGRELEYTIFVKNLGQQASDLLIYDVLPDNTTYVPGSGGQLIGDEVQWNLAVLNPGERQDLIFRVIVDGGREIVNADYQVISAEGVSAVGAPVITRVKLFDAVFMPAIFK
jgi:uncharacterized repeat protein (TIGR01451 family)